jgi:hypothetical protein
MFSRRENSPPPCRLAFAQLVRRPETAIDLAEATLLIAKEEYPTSTPAYLARLMKWARCPDARGHQDRVV